MQVADTACKSWLNCFHDKMSTDIHRRATPIIGQFKGADKTSAQHSKQTNIDTDLKIKGYLVPFRTKTTHEDENGKLHMASCRRGRVTCHVANAYVLRHRARQRCTCQGSRGKGQGCSLLSPGNLPNKR